VYYTPTMKPSTAPRAPALSIREMAHSDIPAVSALASSIWHRHYPDIISREQIDYMLELMYSPEALMRQLESGHRFWLLEQGQKLAGYLSGESRSDGEWFVHKLYVDQSAGRQGLGSALLCHLIDTEKPKTLSLAVNRKNYKAINFYFRHGFFIEKLVMTEIGSGFVMDDFGMKKIL
jgi:diamine N-acetyltransferase